MRIAAHPPSLPLFAWFPIYMGNHYVWLERVDLTLSMMLGIPYFSLRLPAKR